MIGVVAHDAGGAEIVSSYVRRNRLECVYALGGPAAGIFARKLGPVDSRPLETVIASCERLLCGTSLTAELEWRAIGLAREAGRPAAAVLDHWVNYRLRFVRDGIWHFPDEVWAGDEVAQRLAAETLPEVACRLVPNAYFADIVEEVRALGETPRAEGAGARILYTCSPMRDGGEADALRYFLANVRHIDPRIDSITLRPHPREEPAKYAWAAEEFDLPIAIGADATLVEQIGRSDVVAGCATMAMVAGLLAGRRVVSCIPPGSPTIGLPHAEIERLQDLVDAGVRSRASP